MKLIAALALVGLASCVGTGIPAKGIVGSVRDVTTDYEQYVAQDASLSETQRSIRITQSQELRLTVESALED